MFWHTWTLFDEFFECLTATRSHKIIYFILVSLFSQGGGYYIMYYVILLNQTVHDCPLTTERSHAGYTPL